MLQRQIERPRFTPTDRTILAVLSLTFERRRLGGVMLIVKPATVIGWHRRLVARHWTQPPEPEPVDRPHRLRSADSSSASIPTTQPGATDASTANSLESALLAALGGALGAAVTYGYATRQGWRIDIPTEALGAGVAAALALGALAGLYPAIRAARLDPADAVRPAAEGPLEVRDPRAYALLPARRV